MSDPDCGRGCTERGAHFAACPDYPGGADAACKGCVPVPAREGARLCDRCLKRVDALLGAAPDLLAHIRAQVDPLKATAYDKEPGGSRAKDAPPPVPVELLDAVDEIMTVLWAAQQLVLTGEAPQGRYSVASWSGVLRLHAAAADMVADIRKAMPVLATTPAVVQLADALINQPADKDRWSMSKAQQRWGMTDSPWWAAQPCPTSACGLLAVKVSPPRVFGDDTRYECTNCGWKARPADIDICAAVFSKREGKAA